MKKLNLKKYKKLLEGKVIYFATADRKARPNLICVEGNRIINNQLLITNNCFKKTLTNLKENNKIAFIATGGGRFLQFRGIAKHYSSGKYLELVKSLPTNKNYSPKGAVLIKVQEIYDLDNLKRIY